MKLRFICRVALVVCFLLTVAPKVGAQQSTQPAGDDSGARGSDGTTKSIDPVARGPLIRFSGTLKDTAKRPRTSPLTVVFTLYREQQGGSGLWTETQNVDPDAEGRYSVLLGAAQDEGLPLSLFTSGEARWLGARPQLPGEEEQPRVLLVSVPYALKAADADTLGGKPLSAFLLAEVAGSGRAGGDPQSGTAGTVKPSSTGGPPFRAVGTANYIAKFDGSGGTVNSVMYEASGAIGIGTTSPRSALDVYGGIIRGGTYSASVGLDLSGWTTAPAADFLYPNGGRFRAAEYGVKGTNDIFLQALPATSSGYGFLEAWTGAGIVVGTGGNSSPVIFQVDRTERARIDGNGNLGIGTATPGSRLAVQGSTTDDTASAFHATNSAAGSLLFVRNDGKVGIGTNAPAEKLSLAGNLKITGSGNGIVFPDGSAQTTAAASPVNTLEVTRAVPVTSNGYIEIGNYNINNGAHNVRLSVTVSDSGFWVAKTYAITAKYSHTGGAWQKVLPVSTSGADDAGNDFDLEINGNGNQAVLRLRRIGGSAAGNAVVRIESVGITSDVFTATSNTGTAAGTLPIFSGAGTGSGVVFPDGSVQTKAAKVASIELSRAVPTAVNDYVELGYLTAGAHNVRVSVTTSDYAFSLAKAYVIPVQDSQTGNTWQKVQPVSQTGAYSSNDYDLEINVNASGAYLRLRRTGGTNAGTAFVRLEFLGLNTDAFTETFATGTVTGQSPVYSSAVLTQVAGRAEVAGNVKLTGTGNGILFPDGTTQTTACGALAFGVPGGYQPAAAGRSPSESPVSADGEADSTLRSLTELLQRQQAQISELRAELEALRGKVNGTTATGSK